MATAMVKHVVLDSGAFLRNAPVKNIAENVYTIEDVVDEIRDSATKQRLQVLPYELQFREPPPEAIKAVSEFSKKTGDYKSLSAVDIRVMALTYQLEKEKVGTDHIKTVPDQKAEWNATKGALERATDIAGFYVKPRSSKPQSTASESSTTDGTVQKDVTLERLQPDTGDNSSADTSENASADTRESASAVAKDRSDLPQGGPSSDAVVTRDCVASSNSDDRTEPPGSPPDDADKSGVTDGQVVSEECLEEEEEEEEEEEDEEESDEDDDGWITPSNIVKMKEKMGVVDMTKAEQDIPVGCLTTDFAMQNVLIQMGLNVISVDGMLIKRAKSYVLRCFACFKLTTDVQKEFCPHCGNNTLNKVSMTVNEDGSIRYFLSRRKPVTSRGLRHQLPAPKGGKHANNPVLFEDQPLPQQRPTKKSQQKLDMFSPEYVANTSPFALNDVTSRAAQLGIRKNRHQRDRRGGRRK